MDVQISNNFYKKLRDIFFIIFGIGCFIPIILEVYTNIKLHDDSMQKLLLEKNKHNINHNSVCGIIGFIFIFSIGLGCCYIPSLIIDTFKTCIFKNITADDILLFERYILTVSFTATSTLPLICMYYNCKYTAVIYLSLFRLTFISFSYITSRILNKSILKNRDSMNSTINQNLQKKDLEKSNKINSLDYDLEKSDKKIINKKIYKSDILIKESESKKDIKILQNVKTK